MKNHLALLVGLLVLAGMAEAAPFIRTTPVTTSPRPTHCGVYLDSSPVADSPVVTDTNGTYCHYDLKDVANGAHTYQLTYKIIDPIWGTYETAKDTVSNFTRPVLGPVAIPAGDTITPN
jgi:hypothetical protein